MNEAKLLAIHQVMSREQFPWHELSARTIWTSMPAHCGNGGQNLTLPITLRKVRSSERPWRGMHGNNVDLIPETFQEMRVTDRNTERTHVKVKIAQ